MQLKESKNKLNHKPELRHPYNFPYYNLKSETETEQQTTIKGKSSVCKAVGTFQFAFLDELQFPGFSLEVVKRNSCK